MNQDFRLALQRNWKESGPFQVIDFTRYDLPAKEPLDPMMGKNSRNWSLMNRINQKGTRLQDQPIPFTELTADEQKLIRQHYSDRVLFESKP